MYQVLGYLVLSVGVAVGQVASIVVAVFVFTQVAAPDMLWWGFPLSAGVMLLVQVGITWRMSRGKSISPLTLIPAPDAARTYSTTVPSGQVSEALAEVHQFLKNAKCPDSIAEKSLQFTKNSLTDADADIADLDHNVREVGVEEQADEGRDDVADQRVHDGRERRADDHADGHVQHVAAHGERFELFKKLLDALDFFFCHSNTAPFLRPGRIHYYYNSICQRPCPLRRFAPAPPEVYAWCAAIQASISSAMALMEPSVKGTFRPAVSHSSE